jgi:hypothetical protein
MNTIGGFPGGPLISAVHMLVAELIGFASGSGRYTKSTREDTKGTKDLLLNHVLV